MELQITTRDSSNTYPKTLQQRVSEANVKIRAQSTDAARHQVVCECFTDIDRCAKSILQQAAGQSSTLLAASSRANNLREAKQLSSLTCTLLQGITVLGLVRPLQQRNTFTGFCNFQDTTCLMQCDTAAFCAN